MEQFLLMLAGLFSLLAVVGLVFGGSIWLCRRRGREDPILVLAILGAILAATALAAIPGTFVSTIGTVQELVSFHDRTMALVEVKVEDDMAVLPREAAWLLTISQAGRLNVPAYNAELRKLHYWNSLPWVGFFIYDPPERLRFFAFR